MTIFVEHEFGTWECLQGLVAEREFGAVIPVKNFTLTHVHPRAACAGRPCVIHNPTDHHMKDWPLLWRDDRGIFERICIHGVGHPDPDQFQYWEDTNREHEAIHGCDGCCVWPEE